MRKFRPGHVALERALSKLGIASRTQAREWIVAGQVKVNGVIKTNPAFGINPERSKIEISGVHAHAARRRFFMLNKPRGFVSTCSDEKSRKTVFDLLPDIALHLITVGRLDLATSGLLLLTNDTQTAAWLTDPLNKVIRTYLVTVQGKIGDEDCRRVERGIQHEGEELKAEEVLLRKSSGKESHLTVKLSEGKNREIRRIFSTLGHSVTKLKRVSYGNLELGELKSGDYREISPEEMERSFPDLPRRASKNFKKGDSFPI